MYPLGEKMLANSLERESCEDDLVQRGTERSHHTEGEGREEAAGEAAMV